MSKKISSYIISRAIKMQYFFLGILHDTIAVLWYTTTNSHFTPIQKMPLCTFASDMSLCTFS